MHGAARRAFTHLIAVYTIEPGAVRIPAVGVLIRERGGVAAGVPFLAGGRAGVAAHAGIEVDDEAQLFRGRTGESGHRRPPAPWSGGVMASGSNRGQVRAS